MHMVNGRMRQVGRDNGLSLGYWGVGVLGATVTGPDGLPITVPDSPATSSGSNCVNGYDQYGEACQDWTPITSSPAATALALNYLNTPTAPAAKAPASSGIDPTALLMIAGIAGVVFLVALTRR